MLEPTSTSHQTGTSIGVVLLVINLLVGAVLGSHYGATEVDTDVLNLVVVTSGGGSFNWLIFSIFAAAGMVCLGSGLAAASVSATLHNLAVIDQARSE